MFFYLCQVPTVLALSALACFWNVGGKNQQIPDNIFPCSAFAPITSTVQPDSSLITTLCDSAL